VASSEAPPGSGPLVTKDICYPLTLRGADGAARELREAHASRRAAGWSPRRDISPIGRVSDAGRCRTGRIEAWCTWSYWSSLPLPPWRGCGCSSAGSKPRWTPSMASPQLWRLWPHPRGRRAERGPAAAGVAYGCRGRLRAPCWGGSLQLRLDLMALHALRAARPGHAPPHDAKMKHALLRATRRRHAPPHDAKKRHALRRAAQLRHEQGQFATTKSACPIPVAAPPRVRGASNRRGGSRWQPDAYPTSPVTSATLVSPVRRMFGQ
jgi:hypothetical protein